MSSFEQDKSGKLKRLIALRVMNALGMIRWQKDRYGCAQQQLRLLHPLSIPYLVIMVAAGVILHGVVDVWKELKELWRTECAWW